MLRYLVNNHRTDKNTSHSYLEVYEPFIRRIRDSAQNVMEIGLQKGGGSLMFHDYFTRAMIFGVDIEPYEKMLPDLKQIPRLKIVPGMDAFSPSFVKVMKDHGLKFDFILDDGPHTLESFLFGIKNFLDLLTDDGIFIIEDIQEYEWTKQMVDAVPESMRKAVFVIDRRGVKGRYDDIVFVFDKYYL